MATPTTVSYNSNKLEPAPLISFSKNYQRSGDGTKLGSLFRIVVQGTLMAIKGSPDSSGTFYTGSKYWPDGRDSPSYNETLTEEQMLASILRKQEAIRSLFSNDGYSFEVQSGDGSQPLKCNPRIIDISFPEGIWYDTCPYTITMEADVVYLNGTLNGEDDFSDKINQADENWTIETIEDSDVANQHTYRLSHQISATGKSYYDETGTLTMDAWKQAQSFVQARLGYDSSKVSTSIVGSLGSVSPYNHVRSETIDELTGSYSVTETWTLSNTSYTETFEVVTNLSEGNAKVNISGSINGLETRNSSMVISSSKIDNAESRWSSVESLLHTRCQDYSGKTLNVKPVSYSITRNITNGVINYNYEYDNVSNVFTDAINESIQVSTSTNVDVFGEIFVLGRSSGPVLQDLGTKRGKTKTLSIEVTFEITSVGYDNPLLTTYSSTLDSIISSVEPSTTFFIEENNDSWDVKTGKASFTRSWKWD